MAPSDPPTHPSAPGESPHPSTGGRRAAADSTDDRSKQAAADVFSAFFGEGAAAPQDAAAETTPAEPTPAEPTPAEATPTDAAPAEVTPAEVIAASVEATKKDAAATGRRCGTPRKVGGGHHGHVKPTIDRGENAAAKATSPSPSTPPPVAASEPEQPNPETSGPDQSSVPPAHPMEGVAEAPTHSKSTELGDRAAEQLARTLAEFESSEPAERAMPVADAAPVARPVPEAPPLAPAPPRPAPPLPPPPATLPAPDAALAELMAQASTAPTPAAAAPPEPVQAKKPRAPKPHKSPKQPRAAKKTPAPAVAQASIPAQESAVPEVPLRVEFRPRTGPRKVVSVLLLLALAATGVTVTRVMDSQTTVNLVLLTIMGMLSVALFAVRGTMVPVKIVVDAGQLTVTRGVVTEIHDLTSVYNDVMIDGDPSGRKWAMVLSRPDMPPIVVKNDMVDGKEFVRVVDYWRPRQQQGRPRR